MSDVVTRSDDVHGKRNLDLICATKGYQAKKPHPTSYDLSSFFKILTASLENT
jgi:hypothetical protein